MGKLKEWSRYLRSTTVMASLALLQVFVPAYHALAETMQLYGEILKGTF